VGHLKGIRVGVIRHFFETELRANPEAVAALDNAIAALRDCGAHITPITLAPMMAYSDVRVLIQEAEAFAMFHAALCERADSFGQYGLGRVLPGGLVPA
ncbi:MAG: amidase, partial [Betaproteobacteria bacterium]